MNRIWPIAIVSAMLEIAIGCSPSPRVCNVDVLDTDNFYVEGQHCATNLLPSLRAIELGEAIMRVHIPSPERFNLGRFVYFMWYAIDRSAGVLAIPEVGDIPFGVGPGCSCSLHRHRIAFTSSKLHYRKDGEIVTMPIGCFNQVCRMFREQDKESTLELGFQGDRSMIEVMDLMKIAKVEGFKYLRICYYCGVVQDDGYDIIEL